jgi:hypothetical protein
MYFRIHWDYNKTETSSWFCILSLRIRNMPNRILQSSQQRPLGLTIIAVLVGIQSLVFLLVGITSVSAASANGKIIVLLAVVGIVSLVFGLIAFFLCRGLLALKRWAFWGTLILQALSLIGSLVELTQANASISSIVSSIVLPVVILVYFLADRNVRELFHS